MRISSGSRAALALAILGALLTAPSADAAVFSCDESGILIAVGTGGGPHTFSCVGPTTVTVSSTVFVFPSAILDGEGNLTLSGGDAVRVLSVPSGATLELRDFVITEGNGNGSFQGG
jgi:hypothetical protein